MKNDNLLQSKNILFSLQGKPRPKIIWTKDGQSLDAKDVGIRNSNTDTILFIRKAELHHSGAYEVTLQIENMTDKVAITIQIIGKHMTSSKLSISYKIVAILMQSKEPSTSGPLLWQWLIAGGCDKAQSRASMSADFPTFFQLGVICVLETSCLREDYLQELLREIFLHDFSQSAFEPVSSFRI